MNGRGYGLAEVGLFLLLAFVLPGFVYLVFFVFLFTSLFAELLEASKFGNNLLLFVITLGIIGGLLLTSVCFLLELVSRWLRIGSRIEPLLRKIKLIPGSYQLFPDMGISRLGKYEAKGRNSLYLRQVTGQAIMHLNIAMGVLIMLTAYLVYYCRVPQDYNAISLHLSRWLTTAVISFVNFPIACLFYNWGKWAMDDVEKMNAPNLYIFDLHGTLIQGNENAIYAILGRLFEERNIDVKIDRQKIAELMVAPLKDIIACFVPDASPDEMTEMTARFRELSQEISPKYLEPIEGAKETLAELKRGGNKIAIVTSANQRMANRMIEWVNLANLIDELIGMKDGEDPIPFKSRSIQELGQRYRCEKVYMIGDKDEDMKAGHEAGAITVLFGLAETGREYANVRITNLRALLDLQG